MKAIILSNNSESINNVYGDKEIQRLRDVTTLLSPCVNSDELGQYKDVEVIFSTWGMPALSIEEIKNKCPQLKAIFYAAGSVRGFAAPFLDSGVQVFSAWKINAIPVAEYTIAHITLAAQGYHRNIADYKNNYTTDKNAKNTAHRGLGLYDIRVGILGAGSIGQMVIDRLASFDVEVVFMDSRPFARDISMEEVFKTCYIVSSHLPNREDNQKVMTKDMFLSMPEGATFINTGRGAQVDEIGMTEALQQRPDITAIIDVTHPEPVTMDSALMALPNVHISTHIAGSMGNEVRRMSNVMIDDYLSWKEGDATENEVTKEIYEVMA